MIRMLPIICFERLTNIQKEKAYKKNFCNKDSPDKDRLKKKS